jgi:hypothetical protein
MKKLFLMLGILMLPTSPVLAGKNANGAMVVHTDDAYSWTDGVCNNFDAWVPDGCQCLNTRTDKDEDTAALIWFIATFPPFSSPGVSVVYFGNEHNLPAGEDHHVNWGFCGPTGTIELADAGWPEASATAGNTVAFGSPIVGDRLFPFYYVNVRGFADAYYCTAINPVWGMAGFDDDSPPPIFDECRHFGCVRWYEQGYNDCICGPELGACCLPDGSCEEWMPEQCMSEAGEFMGYCVPCDPNPCVASSVPEISTETVTWGRIKSTYRE